MPAHLPDKCERRIDEALAVMSEVNACDGGDCAG